MQTAMAVLQFFGALADKALFWADLSADASIPGILFRSLLTGHVSHALRF